jgi:hypothetical protein
MLVAACSAGGAPSGAPGVTWDVRDAPGAIADVVSTGDLIVAGGTAATADNPAARPAIWLSPDGRAWESATVDGDGEVVALAAGDKQLLATGSRPVGSGSQATAWTSPDGRAWTMVAEELFGPDAGCQSTKAEDIAAGPDGYVVVGTEWGEGGCGQHAAAWVSSNGRTWSRASVPAGGHTMHSVVGGADGYVAAGSGTAAANEGMRAAFWFSPDGRSWTQAPYDAGLHGADAATLIADTTGFLAVGTVVTGRPSDAMVPAAWRSPDGRAWERLATEGFTWDAATAGTGGQLTTLVLTSELVALPSGVLALGAGMAQRSDQQGGAQQASPWRYLGWTSTTGDRWTSVPDDPALIVGTVNTYVLGPSAAVASDGRMFLFGARWPASADQIDATGQPTIWETNATAIGNGS